MIDNFCSRGYSIRTMKEAVCLHVENMLLTVVLCFSCIRIFSCIGLVFVYLFILSAVVVANKGIHSYVGLGQSISGSVGVVELEVVHESGQLFDVVQRHCVVQRHSQTANRPVIHAHTPSHVPHRLHTYILHHQAKTRNHFSFMNKSFKKQWNLTKNGTLTVNEYYILVVLQRHSVSYQARSQCISLRGLDQGAQWVLNKAGVKTELLDTESIEASIL